MEQLTEALVVKEGIDSKDLEGLKTPGSVVALPQPSTFIEIVLHAGSTPEKVADSMVAMAESFRKAAIRLTFPSDWVLFRRVDKVTGNESITGYLQDSGCNRANKVWGCSTVNPTMPEKRIDEGGETYTIVVYGDGYCPRTGERIQSIVGSRSSTDDIVVQWQGEGFPESKIGVRLEQAARASLDGNIIRELTGLDSVPSPELVAAGIDIGLCAYARGFGDGGGVPVATTTAGTAGDVEPPLCEKHGPMKLIPSGTSKKGKKYGAFWACKNRSCDQTMRDTDWREKVASTQTSQTSEPKEPVEELSQPNTEPMKTKNDMIAVLEVIRDDPEADNVIGDDGESLKQYIGGLNFAGLKKEQLETLVLKCKQALMTYKKLIEGATQPRKEQHE